MKSKIVVYTALIAATYWILSMALAPISFGPIQLRVACALYPLAIINPVFIFGFGLGTFLTNLSSPFGAYDIILMPFCAILAGYICWILRKYPIPALICQILIVSLSVSIFPLWLGGGFSLITTFPSIFISQFIVIIGGWLLIWKPIRPYMENLMVGNVKKI